jgi:hypothetical protein
MQGSSAFSPSSELFSSERIFERPKPQRARSTPLLSPRYAYRQASSSSDRSAEQHVLDDEEEEDPFDPIEELAKLIKMQTHRRHGSCDKTLFRLSEED